MEDLSNLILTRLIVYTIDVRLKGDKEDTILKYPLCMDCASLMMHKPDKSSEKEEPVISNTSDYYNLRAFQNEGILVPRKVPVELAIMLGAACITRRLGNKSIDYQYKALRDDLENALKPQSL